MSQNKNDYILPEAETDISVLQNKLIFADDGDIEESLNKCSQDTIIPTEEQTTQPTSFPPHVYILNDMIVKNISYTEYNNPRNRQLLNNTQYMIIKRLFNLYPELYENADDILTLLSHIPSDIRGIATYRILQDLLPSMEFRKSKKSSSKSKINEVTYNDKLLLCMTRYYQISKYTAMMYIDMLYKIGKQSQLAELLSSYGYDEKEIQKILK